MNRRPPRVTSTDTLLPYTTRFRAERAAGPAGAATGVPGTGRRAGAGHRRAGHRSLAARCDTRIASAPGGVPAAGWAHGARGAGDHAHAGRRAVPRVRSEEHTTELQSLMLSS